MRNDQKIAQTHKTAIRKTLICLAGAVVVAPTFAATPAMAQPKELLFNVFFPQRAPIWGGALKPWYEQAVANSNGTIKIKVPTASLAPAPRQFDMVQDGVADITITATLFRRQIVLPNITFVPFLARHTAAASSSLWATHEKFFAAANEYKGFKLLSIWNLGASQIQTISRPVKGISDLKNLKIRTSPGVETAMLKALGGTPIPAPGVKMFELVNGGVVDGNMSALGPAMTLGLPAKIRHITEFPGGLNRVTFSLIMEAKSFAGLPADARRALTAHAGGELGTKLGFVEEAVTRRARMVFKQAGATFTDASPEFQAALAKSLQFVEQDWIKQAEAKGVDGKAALAFYRQRVAAFKPPPGKGMGKGKGGMKK